MSNLSITRGGNFGLKLAAKPKKTKRKLSNAFGVDAEDDGDKEDKNLKIVTYRERVNEDIRQKSVIATRKVGALQARAETEGEAIYDYDSFVTKKQEKKNIYRHNNCDKESTHGGTAQYITGLMTASKAREKEKERVLDRKLIKEREEEKHLYGDLPKFVTSAYKAKLEEDKRFDEAEEAKAAEEERREKRQSMDIFFRNMINGGPSSSNSLQKTSVADTGRSNLRDEAKGVHNELSAAEPRDQAWEEPRSSRERERMMEVEAARQRFLARKQARAASGVWEMNTSS